VVKDRKCPPWCAEHIAGPGGGQHRVLFGDVRLTLVGDSGASRAIYAVRRRAGRTPAEMAELTANLYAAGDLLRGEYGPRQLLRRREGRGPATVALVSA
jgi:hypothetical protein